MEQETFDIEKYPKTAAYVMRNFTVNRRCNRCGGIVLREPEKGEMRYPYQCMLCDEDLYGIETYIGKVYTEEEFQELLFTTRDLLLLDE